MKWAALGLALAAMPIFAAPAAAQANTTKGMAVSSHGNDDTPACLDRLSSLEKRMTRCEEAIHEGHFNVWLDLARLQRIKGDYAAALASIAKLTDRTPDVPTTYATTNSREWIPILETRSAVYAQMGKLDEARRDGDELENINVDGAAGDNAQCWWRAASGQELEKGLEFCDKALARKSHIAEYLDSRGLTYFRLGRFQDALNDFNSALDIDPDMDSSRYARGVAKLRLGDQAGGRKDVADANERNLVVAQEMAGYGVKP